MNTQLRSLLVLAAACAFLTPARAQTGGPVVLDLDLTKGPSVLPSTAQIRGGEWRHGWEQTDNGQRLLFDAGRAIASGALEVTFTRVNWSDASDAYKLPEWLYNTRIIGVGEKPDLGGESIKLQCYSRDRIENSQGIVSGSGLQQKIGRFSEYTSDGQTPMTVRFEWKDGKVSYTDVTGKTISGGKQPGKLRYVALGEADPARRGGALGFRFLSVRLVDLGQGTPPPARKWNRAAVVPQKPVQLPAETVQASARKRVVFDVDLTKGAAALPKFAWVRGGQWDGGWRVTANRERIVFDPGYTIKNGRATVTFTRKDVPLTGEKVDVVSIHETPNIDHTDVHGDAIVLRLGGAEVNMGLQAGIKTFNRERIPAHFGESWGERYGEITEWKLDDKTPHTFVFEWRDGRVYFTDLTGRTLKCTKECDNHMNALRYIAIGGDRYDGGPSLVGARFLSAKLEDLDAP